MKKTNHCFLALSLLSLLFAACAVNKPKTVADIRQVAAVVVVQKIESNNYPLYSFTLFNNRIAFFNGFNKMDLLGNYSQVLSQSDFDKLVKMFGQLPSGHANDTEEDGKLMISIQYYDKPDSKVPLSPSDKQLIRNLDMTLRGLSRQKGWTAPKPVVDQIKTSGDIKNQLILSLPPHVKVEDVLKKYEASCGLKLIKNLAPGGFYFLLSYDAAKKEGSAVIELLKADPQIAYVGFNRVLQER